jgi:hypothetical protein
MYYIYICIIYIYILYIEPEKIKSIEKINENVCATDNLERRESNSCLSKPTNVYIIVIIRFVII